MARRRMIDPNFWQSEDVAKLTIRQRLLLIGLISNADDEGKLRGKPAFVRSVIFPYEDFSLEEIENDLDAIQSIGTIIRYEVDGNGYIKLVNWRKFQRVDKPQKSMIPDPPANESRSDSDRRSDNTSTNYSRKHSTNEPENKSRVSFENHSENRSGNDSKNESWNASQNNSRAKERKRSKDDYKIDSGYKALESYLEPVSGTSQSSSVNCKDENQKEDISNPSGIESTELSGDGKESSAVGFQDSEEPELGKLARMYEEEGFGALTEMVRETLVQMYDEFGATWVAEAMREAVLQNKRRLKYVAGILENWRREGGMRRSDGSKGAATDAKGPRRSRADPEPVGRYIPDGPPEDPELDEFLKKAGFYDIPGINC